MKALFFISCLLPLLGISTTQNGFYFVTPSSENGTSPFRLRRDSYGGGGYGGGGYGGYGSYGGGGSSSSYGCNCPSHDSSGTLLNFGLGALLGFLFSILPMLTMSMMMTNNSGRSMMSGGGMMSGGMMGGMKMRDQSRSRMSNKEPDRLGFFTDFIEKSPVGRSYREALQRAEKYPECTERWICEATKDLIAKETNKGTISMLTSVITRWALNKIYPDVKILKNIPRFATSDFDCNALSPQCEQPLHSGENETEIVQEITQPKSES